MDEQEQEEVLYRLDEKVDNIQDDVSEVKEDVRANRKLSQERWKRESEKSEKAYNLASSNRIRIAGLGFATTLLLSIAAKNAGLLAF